jgi:hypothetical protein
MAQHPPKDRLRASIAYEAARIIHDLGRHDYTAARNKAARRLGCRDRGCLPGNDEIEQALLEYQQLFHAGDQQQLMQQQRQLALEAMTSLKQFSPRLVGPALRGTADRHTPLQLHLFADCPEDIAMFLLEHGIPYREGDKTLHFPKDKKQRLPAFRFRSGDTEVELICFPPHSVGQPPLSPLDQKPERRATASQLMELMGTEDD